MYVHGDRGNVLKRNEKLPIVMFLPIPSINTFRGGLNELFHRIYVEELNACEMPIPESQLRKLRH